MYESETFSCIYSSIMDCFSRRCHWLPYWFVRADMQLNEKGYYFTVLMFGLFAVVSLQKSVRDRLENLPVTDLYYAICWFATILSIVLLVVGLWNAAILPSEKGFYAFAFLLGLFGAIAVQKNIRDAQAADKL